VCNVDHVASDFKEIGVPHFFAMPDGGAHRKRHRVTIASPSRLAATDPTLNDRRDDLVRTDCSATNVTLAPTDDGALSRALSQPVARRGETADAWDVRSGAWRGALR
jgi:hypothetical protein